MMLLLYRVLYLMALLLSLVACVCVAVEEPFPFPPPFPDLEGRVVINCPNGVCHREHEESLPALLGPDPTTGVLEEKGLPESVHSVHQDQQEIHKEATETLKEGPGSLQTQAVEGGGVAHSKPGPGIKPEVPPEEKSHDESQATSQTVTQGISGQQISSHPSNSFQPASGSAVDAEMTEKEGPLEEKDRLAAGNPSREISSNQPTTVNTETTQTPGTKVQEPQPENTESTRANNGTEGTNTADNSNTANTQGTTGTESTSTPAVTHPEKGSTPSESGSTGNIGAVGNTDTTTNNSVNTNSVTSNTTSNGESTSTTSTTTTTTTTTLPPLPVSNSNKKPNAKGDADSSSMSSVWVRVPLLMVVTLVCILL